MEPIKYEDIRPFRDAEVQDVLSNLLEDKQFLSVLAAVLPGVPSEAIKGKLKNIKSVTGNKHIPAPTALIAPLRRQGC